MKWEIAFLFIFIIHKHPQMSRIAEDSYFWIRRMLVRNQPLAASRQA
jgi:hypothetical protein